MRERCFSIDWPKVGRVSQGEGVEDAWAREEDDSRRGRPKFQGSMQWQQWNLPGEVAHQPSLALIFPLRSGWVPWPAHRRLGARVKEGFYVQ